MSQSTLTPKTRLIDEKTAYRYRATLKDEDGATIAGNVLLTLTLTLYDVLTGDIINSRDAQNVLNANNVTVSAGVLTWKIQANDNAMVDATLATEKHIALFTWTWTDSGGDTRTGRHELELIVRNLGKVT